MKNLFITALLLTFTSSIGLTHGNHDSGHAKPQRGGILRSLETVNLELVQVNKELRIYIYSTDAKPLPLKTKDYPVSATVTYPREKAVYKVPLTDMQDHWIAKVDAKGMHRYSFELSITQGGHDDKVLFTIEPKK